MNSTCRLRGVWALAAIAVAAVPGGARAGEPSEAQREIREQHLRHETAVAPVTGLPERQQVEMRQLEEQQRRQAQALDARRATTPKAQYDNERRRLLNQSEAQLEEQRRRYQRYDRPPERQPYKAPSWVDGHTIFGR